MIEEMAMAIMAQGGFELKSEGLKLTAGKEKIQEDNDKCC